MEKNLNFQLEDLIIMLRKKLISIFLFASAVTAIVVSSTFLLNDYYISSARLTVVEDQSAPSGGAASFLGGFGGGLGMGGSPLNKKVLEVEEIVTSRDFFRQLLFSNPAIFNGLLYADSYDTSSKTLIYESGAPSINEDIIDSGSIPLDREFFDAHSMFLSNFQFDKVLESDYYTISFTHMSPFFAKELLDLVIYEANEIQKKLEIKEANNALEYLDKEIALAKNAEVRGSMSKLVEIQLKTKMIANMRDNHSIKVVDSAFIPTKKSGPLRAIIAFLTFVISIIVIIPLHIFLYSKELPKKSY
jgi:uncharacterized protein involved in exopolysaccharide biosynthesis